MIVSFAVGFFSLSSDVLKERNVVVLTRVCMAIGFLLLVGGGLVAIWSR